MTSNSNIDLSWLQARFSDLSDLKVLAQGGQKEVFGAVHPTDGDVVLKIMHPGASLERTQRELKATLALVAPRVPKIFEFGDIDEKTGKLLWFREQRIDGEPLNDRLKRKVLEPREAMLLALHISEVLREAETAKIVHRDVKPANIMLDVDGNFWLLDFGLARHLDLTSITPTAAIGGCGTIGYAPIEQVRNDKKNIDARADLFALGVTVYEAATGVNPHKHGAQDIYEVLDRVAKRQLPKLTRPYSPEFSDVISTLSQPLAIHRPKTAAEAYAWIAEVCKSEGII